MPQDELPKPKPVTPMKTEDVPPQLPDWQTFGVQNPNHAVQFTNTLSNETQATYRNLVGQDKRRVEERMADMYKSIKEADAYVTFLGDGVLTDIFNSIHENDLNVSAQGMQQLWEKASTTLGVDKAKNLFFILVPGVVSDHSQKPLSTLEESAQPTGDKPSIWSDHDIDTYYNQIDSLAPEMKIHELRDKLTKLGDSMQFSGRESSYK